MFGGPETFANVSGGIVDVDAFVDATAESCTTFVCVCVCLRVCVCGSVHACVRDGMTDRVAVTFLV